MQNFVFHNQTQYLLTWDDESVIEPGDHYIEILGDSISISLNGTILYRNEIENMEKHLYITTDVVPYNLVGEITDLTTTPWHFDQIRAYTYRKKIINEGAEYVVISIVFFIIAILFMDHWAGFTS
jgi:hypothetical protein